MGVVDSNMVVEYDSLGKPFRFRAPSRSVPFPGPLCKDLDLTAV